MEEVHDQTPAGETFGLGLTWWYKTKGFQGLWCINTNPNGCAIVPGPGLKWDGKQQVIDTEFERQEKKFAWHEVLSDITPTSFTQSADIGELGGPLKRWLTIHAIRVPETSMQATRTSSDEAELGAATAKSHEANSGGARCVVDYAPQSPDEAELVRIERDWCDATIDRDAKKLDRIFAEDISWIEDAGYRNKAQVMHRYMVEMQEHVIELRDVRIRMFGNVATVSSHVHFKKTTAGKFTESAHTSVDVFEKRAGRWQLVVE
jgi:ketosteroid isomerase-like protein